MELWTQVILEWINCLDISDTPIKDIEQLRRQKCYQRLIKLLPWKNKDVSNDYAIVTRFLKDEYPEFKMDNGEEEVESNSIYVGSLLLIYVSQELVFHRPMCVKLQHDTQIKIKTFLEAVLPYGKNVTKEILSEALSELGETVPETSSMTPTTQSLKDFFNTPASRSVQSRRRISELNRELRHLRSELEMERFEKADLQLDLENQQKRTQSLQKKLQERFVEMKLLREDQIKPATPQSCKKHKNVKHYQDLCRKEVDRLEHELLQCHCELGNVEVEKESVSKRLTLMERQCTIFKEKCANFESSTESLVAQIEYRERELFDLKMANEELRAHLKERKKSYIADESCEFDSILEPSSPKAGEVLSTIVDLQLQEVKIESDRLNTQLGHANEKLRCMVEENKRLAEANIALQDDVKEMTKYSEENARLKEIALQKCILEEDVVKLQDTVTAKEQLLLSLSVSFEKFSADVHAKMENLFMKLEQSAERVKKLENSKNELQQNYESKIAAMSAHTASLQLEASDMSLQIKSKHNEIEVLSLGMKTLKTECEQLASSVREQGLLRDLKETLEAQLLDKQRLLEQANNTLQENARKLTEYLKEITGLQEIAMQKSMLEKDVLRLEDTVAEKDKLLLSLSVSFEKFSTDIHTKMTNVSKKFNQSAERLKKLEHLKNELQKIYESKITLIASDRQKLNLEREKVLFDLQEINKSNELLRVEVTDLSVDIKGKDEVIERLSSEMKNLKIECDHLAVSLKEQEGIRCLTETLEAELLHKQRLLDQANNDIKLKEETLTDLRSKLDQLTKEKGEMLKIDDLAASHEIKSKSEQDNHVSPNELKLRSQVESLLKEKKALKERLDTVRIRNVKLEKNMDELRVEVKKVKGEQENVLPFLPDMERLKEEIVHLKEENALLCKQKEDLSKQPNEQDFMDRLKEVHGKYEQKLEDIKEKMKMAYNEQVTKLNKMQALAIQKKVEGLQAQMEQQCLKHTEEISKYKEHVGELNKQFWHAVEKFLTEQQQKQEALQQLNELKVKFHGLHLGVTQTQTAVSNPHKCSKLEKPDYTFDYIPRQNMRPTKVLQEETRERRLSVQGIQAMGNAFKSADEDGEVFDNIYLADMKEGYCLPTHDNIDRLSVLQQRNSLYLPHLKSSYPAEMQFYPFGVNEEEIKTGSVTDDVLNDSLNQTLLPDQKPKKKDRTQTSYKKPGPSAQSTNGGRLLSQPGEHRSPGSRVLRERNSDRRTRTTPRGFKHMFNIRRQDENSSVTPKRRISHILRKTRPIERPQKL